MNTDLQVWQDLSAEVSNGSNVPKDNEHRPTGHCTIFSIGDLTNPKPDSNCEGDVRECPVASNTGSRPKSSLLTEIFGRNQTILEPFEFFTFTFKHMDGFDQ